MRRILLLVFLVIFTACDQSPTGRQQLALLPESKLAAMGAQMFAELKRTQPLSVPLRNWRSKVVSPWWTCSIRAMKAGSTRR
ncbi:MAG: hypothetical protein U1F76_17575 [Candidatus Competibacteraceae bacterium]